jgi:DivIVA domain-containing protein
MFVVQRSFRRARRGYDPDEVDRHLELVSQWFTSTDAGRAFAEERAQLEAREAAVAAREAEQARVVDGARLEADATLEGARRRADAILADAERQRAETVDAARAEAAAAEIIRAAEARAEAILTEVRAEAAQLAEQLRAEAEHELRAYSDRRRREADRLVEAARRRSPPAAS